MLVFKGFRDVSTHNRLREPLYYGSFTHPGFPNQYRVVLGAPREDLHYPFHLVDAPNHRIQFVFPSRLRQVAPKLVQNR